MVSLHFGELCRVAIRGSGNRYFRWLTFALKAGNEFWIGSEPPIRYASVRPGLPRHALQRSRPRLPRGRVARVNSYNPCTKMLL